MEWSKRGDAWCTTLSVNVKVGWEWERQHGKWLRLWLWMVILRVRVRILIYLPYLGHQICDYLICDWYIFTIKNWNSLPFSLLYTLHTTKYSWVQNKSRLATQICTLNRYFYYTEAKQTVERNAFTLVPFRHVQFLVFRSTSKKINRFMKSSIHAYSEGERARTKKSSAITIVSLVTMMMSIRIQFRHHFRSSINESVSGISFKLIANIDLLYKYVLTIRIIFNILTNLFQ